MGYRREPKIYKLTFVDPDMEGLIVRAKSTSVRQFLEIQAMADATEASDGVKGMQTLFATFAGVLVSWNLEDENGQELPTTVDTLLEQEFGFVMQIVMAWIEAVAGVPDQLGKASTGGSPLLEASLPMEPLSISLAS